MLIYYDVERPRSYIINIQYGQMEKGTIAMLEELWQNPWF